MAALLQHAKVTTGRPERLRFVGAHNVAQVTWCPMYAVLKSRAVEEDTFFPTYLDDRIRAACDSKRLGAPPRTPHLWLAIGGDLDLATVEKLQEERRRSDEHRERALGITPSAPRRRPPPASDPFARGEQLESAHGEEHPTVRWHFQWEGYVITAEPDGLREHFVYEFKSHGRRRCFAETRANAVAQADIYGLFFRRKTKRIQIFTREDGQLHTEESPIDAENARATLRLFSDADSANDAPLPPPWKCRRCDYKERCPALARRGTSMP